MAPQPSHTLQDGLPGQSGSLPDTAPSTAAAPAIPSMEEYQRLLKEKESLAQSVRGLTSKQQVMEKELEGFRNPPPPEPGAEVPLYEWDAERFRKEVSTVASSIYQEQRKQDQQQVAQQQQWAAQFGQWTRKAISDFPDAFDASGSGKKDSLLAQEATRILLDPNEGLSFQTNGQFQHSSPHAEYDALARATLRMDAKARAEAESAAKQASDKAGAQFSSTGGKAAGSPASSTGKLSDEEFLALSPDEQQRYQREQFEQKFQG